jgi:hypothetical protein
LDKLPSSTLETFHLDVRAEVLLNEDVPVHHLSISGLGNHIYDRLLQRLSSFSNLRALYLIGDLTVSPTVFHSSGWGTSGISFPQLEEFQLVFKPETSDGRWFYLRDDKAFDEAPSDEDDDSDNGELENLEERYNWECSDEDPNGQQFRVYTDTSTRVQWVQRDVFRTLPNPETLAPLLISAAEACAGMPKIKEFSIKLEDNSRWHLNHDFIDRVLEIWFLAAGTTLAKWNKTTQKPQIPLDTTLTGHNRVYFRVGDYMPDEHVLNSWRKVIGRDGKMISLDEEHCRDNWGRWMQYVGDTLPEV